MFYEITSSAADVQTQLMDKLKSQGCDVIQTSAGLVVRSQERADAFAKSCGLEPNCIRELDPRNCQDLSPDIQKFIC